MGEGFPGRVGASLLRAIGLEEMIAPSLALYESMAAQLTQDEARLSTIKAKLARNREQCPLFDTARFTRDLERAYISMWDRSQRGVAPERFAVGSLA
jgi:predicted O-linked N-acetylglucosamine transferase (SPINDLY family)